MCILAVIKSVYERAQCVYWLLSSLYMSEKSVYIGCYQVCILAVIKSAYWLLSSLYIDCYQVCILAVIKSVYEREQCVYWLLSSVYMSGHSLYIGC